MPPGISKQVYDEYINSSAWRRKRQERLGMDGHRCVLCFASTDLHVHHKSYRNFKRENSRTDLVTLCEKCHRIAESNRIGIRHRRRVNDGMLVKKSRDKSDENLGCLIMGIVALFVVVVAILFGSCNAQSSGRAIYKTATPTKTRSTNTATQTQLQTPTPGPTTGSVFNSVPCKGNRHVCKDVAPVASPTPTTDCKQGWMDNHGVCVWDFAPTRDLLPTVTPTPKG